jgi:3-methyladenine DNA glycosylase AlkC
MTEFFSAEFAIRHFILKQPEQTLAILSAWLEHENHHVRRLVSEGTRPRLPWGVRLPIFIEQPERVMPLLTALRDDEEEYVRRSVANHLNDIAKDHPQLVITTAQAWLDKAELNTLTAKQKKQRIKLIRHACRTLFKQGQPEVMALFGYQPASDVQCELISSQLKVPFHGEFEFAMQLVKSSAQDNLLMVDYVMHFQKANGKQAEKVFKWIDRSFSEPITETINKKHSFKKITTRKYYPGPHKLEVKVNGIKKAQIEFELLPEESLN